LKIPSDKQSAGIRIQTHFIADSDHILNSRVAPTLPSDLPRSWNQSAVNLPEVLGRLVFSRHRERGFEHRKTELLCFRGRQISALFRSAWTPIRGSHPFLLIPVASRNSKGDLGGEIDISPKGSAILSVHIEPAKPSEHTDPQILPRYQSQAIIKSSHPRIEGSSTSRLRIGFQIKKGLVVEKQRRLAKHHAFAQDPLASQQRPSWFRSLDF
jgi:hypothetical protein